ncbi:hypothetical protein D3C85_1520070 [compost metagenome]
MVLIAVVVSIVGCVKLPPNFATPDTLVSPLSAESSPVAVDWLILNHFVPSL